jgi:putative FmdB family regulatory protein
MPTYEYRCSKCGDEFEEFQDIAAEPGAECPKCGGRAERLISGGAAILMKGGDSGAAGSCCGQANPCADPKRCCGE